jgi:hypothetical protein
VTEPNPYEPPNSASEIATRPASSASGPAIAWPVALACYPLPSLASFAAWFAYPFFYFSQPIPFIQGLVVIAAIGSAIALTRTLTARTPAGRFLFIVFSVLHTLAILATPSLALEFYSAPGFAIRCPENLSSQPIRAT